MPSKKKPRTRAVAIGRPTVFTDDVVRKLEEAFMIDATVEEACANAGIGHTAYYDERGRNPVFADRMDRAQQFPFLLAKKAVAIALQKEDGGIAMKWLKNRQRDRYHEKVVEEVKAAPKDGAAELAEQLINGGIAEEPAAA